MARIKRTRTSDIVRQLRRHLKKHVPQEQICQIVQSLIDDLLAERFFRCYSIESINVWAREYLHLDAETSVRSHVVRRGMR